MKKKLPWQGIKGNSYKECYHKLYLMKKYIEMEELCKGLPSEIIDYMNNARSLKFEEEPNYKYLKSLFNNILKKCKFKLRNNGIFDYRMARIFSQRKLRKPPLTTSQKNVQPRSSGLLPVPLMCWLQRAGFNVPNLSVTDPSFFINMK